MTVPYWTRDFESESVGNLKGCGGLGLQGGGSLEARANLRYQELRLSTGANRQKEEAATFCPRNFDRVVVVAVWYDLRPAGGTVAGLDSLPGPVASGRWSYHHDGKADWRPRRAVAAASLARHTGAVEQFPVPVPSEPGSLTAR